MLTVTAIQKAKPTEKQYRLADERGLVLLVRPNGSKLWQLRYRHGGKEKTASLGQYPDVSLSDARVKRDEQRKVVAAGDDPVAVKREQRQAKAAASEHTDLRDVVQLGAHHAREAANSTAGCARGWLWNCGPGGVRNRLVAVIRMIDALVPRINPMMPLA